MRCEVFLRLVSKWHASCLKKVFFVFLCCFVMIAAPGCQKSQTLPSNKDKGPVAVSAITVARADVPVAFEYIAQVKSSQQVNIAARVSGFLDKRVYTEGSIVRQGQKLFLMDQKPFKAQLDQAEAALSRYKAAMQVARLNLNRVKPLAAASALSQKDLDNAVGQFESASAAVEGAKASVEQARLNLSYTVITSPLTGISSDAQQSDGTYLNPSNSLLTTVALISPVYVNFSISENEWLRYRKEVRKGLLIPPKDGDYTAEVVLSDGTLFHNTGKVTFANPSYDPKTGTFLIRATVENPKAILRPNQYVHARLIGALRRNAILVPQRAVQQTSKGHVVWVVEKDGKAEPRPVTVGAWHGNDWFIDEGLHTGDRVIVDGLLKLRPGSEVEVTPLTQKQMSDGVGK
ncbi:MAG: efflux RND transporter periplasmic adaptor subunit [Syntrophobacteraceae bacterium]